MVCDWKAASQRHDDGNIIESIRFNTKRHNLPEFLVSVLHNTVAAMGWATRNKPIGTGDDRRQSHGQDNDATIGKTVTGNGRNAAGPDDKAS